jgi:hypothetical protein
MLKPLALVVQDKRVRLEDANMHGPFQTLPRARTAHATVLLAAAALLAPSPINAQAEIGLLLGTEYGFGALVRAGSPGFHLEAGAGFTPVLVFLQVSGGSDIFRVYFPGTVGAKASFRVRSPEQGSQIDVELGGTYNNLLRLGVGGGISFRPVRSRLLLSGGAMIFPDAKDRLRLRINKDEGTNISDSEFQSPLTVFQPYLSVAILFGH